MKKLILALFILASCNSIDLEPTESNLEKVSITGGDVHSLKDSINLFIHARDIPKKNNWEMIWEVNGSQIDRVDLSAQDGFLATFAKFKAPQPGEYLFSGCLVKGSNRICKDKTFTVL